MNKFALAGVAAVAVAAGAWFATRPGPAVRDGETLAPGAAMAAVTLPETLSEEAQIGQRAFDGVCAACHGDNAAGKMGAGPPLVHKVYEPSHHGDMAFLMAVQHGVQSHHWRFGNMPAQEGLTRADVASIVAYVRELQRANGIE